MTAPMLTQHPDRTALRRYLNDHNEAVPFRKTGLAPQDVEVLRRFGVEL